MILRANAKGILDKIGSNRQLTRKEQHGHNKMTKQAHAGTSQPHFSVSIQSKKGSNSSTSSAHPSWQSFKGGHNYLSLTFYGVHTADYICFLYLDMSSFSTSDCYLLVFVFQGNPNPCFCRLHRTMSPAPWHSRNKAAPALSPPPPPPLNPNTSNPRKASPLYSTLQLPPPPCTPLLRLLSHKPRLADPADLIRRC